MSQNFDKMCCFCLEWGKQRTVPVYREEHEGTLKKIGDKTEYICDDCWDKEMRIIL